MMQPGYLPDGTEAKADEQDADAVTVLAGQPLRVEAAEVRLNRDEWRATLNEAVTAVRKLSEGDPPLKFSEGASVFEFDRARKLLKDTLSLIAGVGFDGESDRLVVDRFG
jgi:hypothetical protein